MIKVTVRTEHDQVVFDETLHDLILSIELPDGKKYRLIKDHNHRDGYLLRLNKIGNEEGHIGLPMTLRPRAANSIEVV